MQRTGTTTVEGSNLSPAKFEGGNLLVRALLDLGVKQIFSVSGGPLNSIYYACAVEGLALKHTRHEAGACFMAEAVSRVSGVPGVAAVTLGPGVTNTVTPALVAKMASVPLLIIGAQANTASFERGAGMSADHVPIMTPVTKWSARVLDTQRIPEYVEIAWRRMWAGTPGPVFLEIPVNVLAAKAEPQARITFHRPVAGLDFGDSAAFRQTVECAHRPLVVLGNDVRWDGIGNAKALIEKNHLPFATVRLARGVIDEHHDLWAGPGYCPCNDAFRSALAEADLIMLVGHTFEFDLDYGRSVAASAKVIQCNRDAEAIGRNRKADFGFASAANLLIDALAAMPFAAVDRAWVNKVVSAWRMERAMQLGSPEQAPLHPVAAIDAVIDAMPPDTLFVTSHGNVDFWADARIRLRSPGTYLRAGQAGALGAEIPYGVGAACVRPESPVVVFVGDGGVGYHVTELETAVRYKKQVIVIVLDDEKWAAIALPQRAAYGDEYEMDLPRRDWDMVAQGLGGFGARAHTVEDIKTTMGAALASGKAGLVQIPVRAVLSPYMAYISR